VGQRRNKPIRIRLDIQPGKVTPLQQAAWKKFWRKMITEAYQAMEKPDSSIPGKE